MNPQIAQQIAQHRQELDRLIYRRGDLRTMADDVKAHLDAIEREHDQVVGGIASQRTRITVLEGQARQQDAVPVLGPQLVPAQVTEAPQQGKKS